MRIELSLKLSEGWTSAGSGPGALRPTRGRSSAKVQPEPWAGEGWTELALSPAGPVRTSGQGEVVSAGLLLGNGV